jgi:hypothetical protein
MSVSQVFTKGCAPPGGCQWMCPTWGVSVDVPHLQGHVQWCMRRPCSVTKGARIGACIAADSRLAPPCRRGPRRRVAGVWLAPPRAASVTHVASRRLVPPARLHRPQRGAHLADHVTMAVSACRTMARPSIMAADAASA